MENLDIACTANCQRETHHQRQSLRGGAGARQEIIDFSTLVHMSARQYVLRSTSYSAIIRIYCSGPEYV
jgi:hypothetical protein